MYPDKSMRKLPRIFSSKPHPPPPPVPLASRHPTHLPSLCPQTSTTQPTLQRKPTLSYRPTVFPPLTKNAPSPFPPLRSSLPSSASKPPTRQPVHLAPLSHYPSIFIPTPPPSPPL